jgi:outer membrane protein assembly factor BamB
VWSRQGIGLAGSPLAVVDLASKAIVTLDGGGRVVRTTALPALSGTLEWARSGDRIFAVESRAATVTTFELATPTPTTITHSDRVFDVNPLSSLHQRAHAFADGVWLHCRPSTIVDDFDDDLCFVPNSGGASPMLPGPFFDVTSTSDSLFVSSETGLTAYDPSGNLRWNVRPIEGHVLLRVAAAGPLVAVISRSRGSVQQGSKVFAYRIMTLDAKTGAKRWEYAPPLHEDLGEELLAVGDDRVAYTSLEAIHVVDGAGREVKGVPLASSRLEVTTEFISRFPGEYTHGDLVIAGRYLAVLRDKGLEVYDIGP